MNLSIVIPLLNEQESLPELHNWIVKVMQTHNYSYEILFIDDGSSDNTFDEINKLYRTNDNVVCIKFSRNFGKESAIYAGIENSKGDYITVIDADLQQNPSLILKMLELLEKKRCDCVAAYQKERHEDKIIVFFKHNFYSFYNKISDIKIVNGASDFRTFTRKFGDSILSLPEYYRFSKGIFSIFIILLF